MKPKTLFDKLLMHDKKNDQLLNKTLKRSDLQKCTKFCKQDYMPNVHKTYKKMFGTMNNYKQMNKSMFYSCKKDYCNPTCNGFFNPSDRFYKQYRKKIHNGFHKKYTKKQIGTLKNRGVLSACFRNPDYKF